MIFAYSFSFKTLILLLYFGVPRDVLYPKTSFFNPITLQYPMKSGLDELKGPLWHSV